MHLSRLLCSVTAVGLLVSATPAFSGVMAVSILEINNFMATDTAGNQLQLGTHIGAIFGNNTADVAATLNGITAADSATAPVGAPPAGDIDLLQQCVGTCPPFPENSYAGFGFVPPPLATYAVSDMVLTGTAIDTSPVFPNSGGVDASTRADVAIASGSNDGTSVTNSGADVAFVFAAASDLTAQFELDFIRQLRAYLETVAGETGSAQTTISWDLNLINLTEGGAEILNWAPSQLNTSRSATLGPLTNIFIDDSGSLISPTFTLEAGDLYQISIRHASLADATFAVAVPEPLMAGLFGGALIMLGAAKRKSR